jgi:hypothetical protein
VTEFLTRARSLGLGASGVGFGLLRHREDLVARGSGSRKRGDTRLRAKLRGEFRIFGY